MSLTLALDTASPCGAAVCRPSAALGHAHSSRPSGSPSDAGLNAELLSPNGLSSLSRIPR